MLAQRHATKPSTSSGLQVALIQCAQAMGIQRYIFFSIHNCERHPEVPLMLIKSCTEEYLRQSGLNFTIFRLCGFMQASNHVALQLRP
jgi:NmrA-like family